MDSEKPNILIILADQLRRQALSCYGDKNIETVNIDALAAQGVKYTRSYASFPVCVPFRFSLMTGQHAHTRGMPSIGYRMSPAERTLADEWNDAGYHSVYVGKWHLYGGGHGMMPDYDNITTNRLPVPRDHQGRWQKWFGFELCNSHFDTCYFEDDDPTPRKIDGYQTDGLFDLTMNYLATRKEADEPFACVLSVEPPHPPYEAPKELEEKWLKAELNEDPSFMVPSESLDRFEGQGQIRDQSQRDEAIHAEQLYYAMVENLDQNVGRMMAFLEEQGLRENTIVVLLADHGHCGYRHCWQQKTIPFEESIGIPLIVSDPRHAAATQSECHELFVTEDLYPTLLGLTGVKGHETPGLDMSAPARGEELQETQDAILIENTYIIRPDLPRFDKGWRGVVSERYKYTIEGGILEGGLPWQFFDLQEDPYELNNLVGDPVYAKQVQRHHHRLCELLVKTGDSFHVAPAFGHEALNPILRQ